MADPPLMCCRSVICLCMCAHASNYVCLNSSEKLSVLRYQSMNRKFTTALMMLGMLMLCIFLSQTFGCLNIHSVDKPIIEAHTIKTPEQFINFILLFCF